VLASKRGAISGLLSCLLFINLIVSTHSTGAQTPNWSRFIDPSADVQCGESLRLCSFGEGVYIGPFATLKTGSNARRKSLPSITIGDGSNVQDNALLDATNGRPITLGDSTIVAHGASIYGGAEIGMSGVCEPSIFVCATFVGFNSEIAEGAIVERNAMVTHLARVGPGVKIPSGRVVPPGRNVETQAQVDTKTIPITAADRQFMDGVIRVNLALTIGYNNLKNQRPSNVCGINYNPITDFISESKLPTLGGTETQKPESPNRIIGNIQLADAVPRMGKHVSLRADEGTPFIVGTIGMLDNFATFHALDGTRMTLGNNGRYGVGSLMHGGKFNNNLTITADNFTIGDNSVFYNSTAGPGSTIGAMSFVSDANLTAANPIGDNIVLIGSARSVVEWDRRPRPDPTSRVHCPAKR
jgi:carbonic anhydrase/acetyltransferase-like protein (isoleucine patch superfamily)